MGHITHLSSKQQAFSKAMILLAHRLKRIKELPLDNGMEQ